MVKRTRKIIKLGFPSGLTGAYKGLAENQLRGVTLAVDQINKKGGVLGKKVKIIPKDDQLNPVLTTKVTKELIRKDKIDFIVGALSAGTQLQVNKETKKAKMLFMSIAQTNELTMSQYLGPYTFHQALTPHMNDQAIAKWTFDNLGRKWLILVADYAWGLAHIEGYKAFAKNNNVKIVDIIKVPFPAKDKDAFTKHFSAILKKKPEVLILGNAGNDQKKFIEDAHKANLKSKVSIIHTAAMLSVANSINAEESVGMYWGAAFYWGLKDILPTTKKFVEAFQDKFKTLPSSYAAYGYSGAMEMLYAVNKAGEYPINPDKVAKELEGRTFAHYKHPEWWRPCDHQAFQDLYILKFKGPEERKHENDSSEIIGTVSWDLDFGRPCASIGHSKKMWGHIE